MKRRLRKIVEDDDGLCNSSKGISSDPWVNLLMPGLKPPAIKNIIKYQIQIISDYKPL